jgi:hypothetical protein
MCLNFNARNKAEIVVRVVGPPRNFTGKKPWQARPSPHPKGSGPYDGFIHPIDLSERTLPSRSFISLQSNRNLNWD